MLCIQGAGLLSVLLHKSITAFIASGAAGADPANLPPGASIEFIDALLAMLAPLVQTTTGCQALADAGVVQALLPLLHDCW